MFWDASSRRVCGHLLHYQCAQELPSKSFPSCRPRSPLTPPHLSPGASVEELPALPLRLRQGGRAAVARASARGVLPHRDKARTSFLFLSVRCRQVWFRTCDVKGDGYLSKQEVINVLLSQFPLDVDRFEARMEDAWPQVDPNGDGYCLDGRARCLSFLRGPISLLGDGYVSRDEFFAPETGLLALVRANLTDDMRVEPVEAAPPDVRTQRNAWFDHFDEDKTGSLTQEELTRALVKTYALGADLAQVRTMRDFVAAVFPAFTAEATISRDAFLRPGEGLADTIIAQLDHLSPRPSPSGV